MSSISSIFLIALSLGGPLALQAGPLYSIETLGQLGSGAAAVYAVNHSGTAAGFQMDAYGNLTAVTVHNGQTTALDVNAMAFGINDAGTIIGSSYATGAPAITEWSGGKQVSLQLNGYGMAINQSGTIAGSYQTASGDAHAFTLTAGGHMTDLGTLGGSWSSANAITASGKVTGTSSLPNGALRAFISHGTALQAIPTLGGKDSYGLTISGNGAYVAGASENSAGYLNAFIWSAGSIKNLGTLGGYTASANGVNDAGWVVGDAETSSMSQDAFLYENGSMLDLNNLLPIGSGWNIENAQSIDNAGNILATASRGDQTWAVELVYASPLTTPEPAAMALVAAGLIALSQLNPKRKHAPPPRESAHL